jgi:hypothetical protein
MAVLLVERPAGEEQDGVVAGSAVECPAVHTNGEVTVSFLRATARAPIRRGGGEPDRCRAVSIYNPSRLRFCSGRVPDRALRRSGHERTSGGGSVCIADAEEASQAFESVGR